MKKLHEELSQIDWYRTWHEMPNISYVHFAVLVAVSGLVAFAVPQQILRDNQLSAALIGTLGNQNGASIADETHAGLAFGPWFSISHWSNCSHLMQQGSVFQLQNTEGNIMMSVCTVQVPKAPFDWHSEPVRFRLVKEPHPNHSPQTPHPNNAP